jgi:hypothetical protein
MGYIPLAPQRIQISIPDFISGETVIKRTATLFTLVYNQAAGALVLTWIVKHFAKNEDNTAGEYLGGTIPDWSKESLADNTSMCDVTNGHPIEKINVGTEEEPVYDYDPNINYTGQYDFFNQAAEAGPLQVHDMIREFGSLVESWDKK